MKLALSQPWTAEKFASSANIFGSEMTNVSKWKTQRRLVTLWLAILESDNTP